MEPTMNPSTSKPYLEISADSRNFDEEALQGIVTALQPYFEAHAYPLVQKALEAPANVFIQIALPVLQTVGSTVLASVLAEAIKNWLWKPKKAKHSTFIFWIKGSNEQAVEAVLDTEDEEVMHHALETFHDLARTDLLGTKFVYDSKRRQWKQQTPQK